MSRPHRSPTSPTSPAPSTSPSAKPRLFRFGPGLLLALIAAVVLWQRLLPPLQTSETTSETTSEKPLRLNGGRPGTPLGAQTATSLSAPDPDWLVTQRAALQLNAAQWQNLKRLRGRWERDTRSLRSALQQASADFERRMTNEGVNEQRHEQRGVTAERLQEQAAPLSELSRQLGDARRAWWGEAQMLLTPAQRQRAEKAWTQHLTRRFRAP